MQACDVWPGLEPYVEAFQALTARRPWAIGMAGAVPGGIPFAEIAAYARLHGHADDPDFVALVVAQDDAWLAHFGERAARKNSPTNGTPPPEGGVTDGG